MSVIEYDETADYVILHKQFLTQHPHFKKGCYDVPYLDIIDNLYSRARPNQNQFAYKWLISDMSELYKNDNTLTKLEKYFKQNVAQENSKYFVTINFKEETFEPQIALKFLNTLGAKDFVKQIDAVFEYNTETGHHPHVMFSLTIMGKLPKGRLAQKIYQTAGIKRLIETQNFIDVKVFKFYHTDYLDLYKNERKLEFIEKDIVWRQENNIPERIKIDK